MRKQQLTRFIDQVIAQGEALQRQGSTGSKSGALATSWYPRVMSVFHVLGSRADPWKFAAAKCPTDNSPGTADKLLGVLQAIREAVDGGLLAEIESEAHADAFGALLEKGQQLVEEGHLIAAGAVGQSVLEEHLRELCVRVHGAECHSSASELVASLYRNGHVTKADMETVDALCAVGEHCVQNKQPPLRGSEVEMMLDGVKDFLREHPLP